MEIASPVYQTLQIREIENIAIKQFNISEDVLMKSAGEAAYNLLEMAFPEPGAIAVICGKGNNAGDGYILALAAHHNEKKVTVYSLGDWRKLKGAALAAAKACHNKKIPIKDFTSDTELSHYDVIVDAILGMGIKGDVKPDAAIAIQKINDADADVLSIDVPSGICPDTGCVQGVAVQATLTVTFIAMKQGLLTHVALEYCGVLECDDLGLPEEIFESVSPAAFTLDRESVQTALQPRRRDSHKGDYGHVLVIGGDYGMAGAAALSGEAAARVGAGLVSVATRPEHVSAIVSMRPELMCHGVSRSKELIKLFERASCIVLGPGLGDSRWSTDLLKAALATDLPMVLDASALPLLAKDPVRRYNWVLTPHPGEAATLLGTSIAKIQTDRFLAAKKIQEKFSGVVVLKGAGSIVQGKEPTFMLCDAGNPGMASGGMGDILSGVIGGLLAQKLSLFDAACVGTYIHSLAGDAAAALGERGILASDLLPHLQSLMNSEIHHLYDDWVEDDD